MKGSARFRQKRAVAVKTDEAEDMKDHVTAIQKRSRICDLNSEPSYQDDESTEMSPMKGIKTESDIHVTSFTSLLCNNLKAEAAEIEIKQGDSNHGPKRSIDQYHDQVDGSGSSSELVLRGCMRCYYYVLVCEDNPKCPNCRKADCLRELFLDQKPVPKGNKIMKRDHDH